MWKDVGEVIPADRILIDDDRAWLVVPTEGWPGPIIVATWHGLNRPCETCQETKLRFRGTEIPCGDNCIDGRHTFDIEVECEFSHPEHRYTLRVCVVRMLPIVAWDTYREDISLRGPFIFLRPNDTTWLYVHTSDITPITLPSAAAPDMHVVELKVSTDG